MKTQRQIKAQAAAGDVAAQCRLAWILMSAETRAGYARALPLLRRAARAGERWAEYHLGLIYDKGLAGRRDVRRAVKWYERSASKGYDSAQLNLGIILANRRGRHRDLRRAIHLYRLAFRQGRRHAAYNLGLYYQEGRGVPRSLSQARRWYQKAADFGDPDARRILKKLGRASNPRVNPPHSGVTALAQGSKRRAAGRAGYAHR